MPRSGRHECRLRCIAFGDRGIRPSVARLVHVDTNHMPFCVARLHGGRGRLTPGHRPAELERRTRREGRIEEDSGVDVRQLRDVVIFASVVWKPTKRSSRTEIGGFSCGMLD